MTRRRSESVLARRFSDGGSIDEGRRPEELIVEEPLEIRLDGTVVATTMRTPGHDFELAAGLCFTDGLLGDASVETCRYCGTGSAVDTEFNVVSIDTGGKAPEPTSRLTTTSSSCGICGSTQIDELTARLSPLPSYEPWPTPLLLRVIDHVRSDQISLLELVGCMRQQHSIEMETFCFFEKTLADTTQSTKSLGIYCWNQNFRPAILRSL